MVDFIVGQAVEAVDEDELGLRAGHDVGDGFGHVGRPPCAVGGVQGVGQAEEFREGQRPVQVGLPLGRHGGVEDGDTVRIGAEIALDEALEAAADLDEQGGLAAASVTVDDHVGGAADAVEAVLAQLTPRIEQALAQRRGDHGEHFAVVLQPRVARADYGALGRAVGEVGRSQQAARSGVPAFPARQQRRLEGLGDRLGDVGAEGADEFFSAHRVSPSSSG